MNNPLVSIITPCYNGEKFVCRFLDSVLSQTYKNIELIIINDGSTDKTEEVILSYEKRMQEKGISFIYLSQSNKGQAAALNQGLKIFKGEYLTWPDSDDILHENYVKIKVNFLERNPEIGILISKCRIIDEDNLNQIGTLQRISSKDGNDNLFYDLIVQKNVFFAPGGYMLRSKKFLEYNPKRFINESRAGQNWQMLLPIAYYSKCGYIDDYLYDYMVRESSHSRKEKSEKEIFNKCNNHQDLIMTIIKGMNIKDKAIYLNIVEETYVQKRLNLAYQFQDIDLFNKNYNLLKNKNLLNTKSKLLKLAMNYKLVRYLIQFTRKLKKNLKGNK